MLELRYLEAPARVQLKIAMLVFGSPSAALQLERVDLPPTGDLHLPHRSPMAERQRRAFAAARARGGLIWQVIGRYQSSPIAWAGHSNRHGRRTGPNGEAL